MRIKIRYRLRRACSYSWSCAACTIARSLSVACASNMIKLCLRKPRMLCCGPLSCSYSWLKNNNIYIHNFKMQAVYSSENNAPWKVILYDQWIGCVDESCDSFAYIKEAKAYPNHPPGPPQPKKVTLIEITVYSNQTGCPQVRAAYTTLEDIYKE